MALGFIPKYAEDIPLDEMPQEIFLLLAVDAAKELDWQISYASPGGFIAYTNNGTFSWNAHIKLTIENGIAKIISSSVGSEMIDFGKNKKNVSGFISTLTEQKKLFDQENFATRLSGLQSSEYFHKEDKLLLSDDNAKVQVKNFFSLFIPRGNFIVTPLLIDLNILLFAIMALTGVDILMPDSESLLQWGANFRPLTLQGEWWRLATSCFLHIGIFHLLMNMYALLYIGFLLEPYLGLKRFLTAYLLTGIVSSVASLWWHDLTISAGASGAIFGMYGVFLAMLTTNVIDKTARKPLLTSIAVFVGYNLLNGMKEGIDNAAHIGGLVSGLIIGYSFIPGLKNEENKRLQYKTMAIISALTIIFSVVVYNSISTDILKYNSKMDEFAAFESKALGVYSLPEGTPSDKILIELKNTGIYYWNESLKLIEEADKYDIPKELHEKNNKLISYCKLRIKSYELIYKAVEEDTDQYQEQIEACDQQVKAIVTELGGG